MCAMRSKLTYEVTVYDLLAVKAVINESYARRDKVRALIWMYRPIIRDLKVKMAKEENPVRRWLKNFEIRAMKAEIHVQFLNYRECQSEAVYLYHEYLHQCQISDYRPRVRIISSHEDSKNTQKRKAA